jgi:hypothetical protein
MSTLEQIEAAILKPPSDEFQRLRQWPLDVNYQRWDEQLEQDVTNGKLDALAEKAIAAVLLIAQPTCKTTFLNSKSLCSNRGTC